MIVEGSSAPLIWSSMFAPCTLFLMREYLVVLLSVKLVNIQDTRFSSVKKDLNYFLLDAIPVEMLTKQMWTEKISFIKP